MERVQCCIAGGGPAGMMLGLLLARAGVSVLVLEKHADFLRDFRGDTLHPSTLRVIGELGLADELLELPHQKVRRFALQFEDATVGVGALDRLDHPFPFIALMPQWDFLDFLARQARRYPGFRLMTNTEATELIEDAGRIVGLRATTPEGPLEVRADLVIGADGRHSTLRAAAELKVRDLGVPIDVLWFRMPRRDSDPAAVMGRIVRERLVVLIDRGSYWQVAYVIRKGSLDDVRRHGLDAFRADVARAVPIFADRLDAIANWDEVKLLTVTIDRLERWHRPGLLCIGDAAHAMSPLGGVGINLAIQDAVATANILAEPLRAGTVRDSDLARLQRRREFPTRVTQRIQIMMQNGLIDPVLTGKRAPKAPTLMRWAAKLGLMQQMFGRVTGIGVRPEHVRTREA
jgi:2-polyprenyl-6-methoxyphenol hydroxylase-like FAD-dependent oxidoreductase